MGISTPTIDLTDDQEDAKKSWDDMRARLHFMASYDLDAHKEQIKMLEIGCGRAEFLRYAKEQGVNIAGVDRNLFGHDDLPIKQADIAESIPFEDGEFDLLYAKGVFAPLHRFDKEKAFSEIQRVMKKGALFVVEDSDQPDFEIAMRHGLFLTSPPLEDSYSILEKR